MEMPRVFSLNFWWGGGELKIFGPRRSPTETKLDGGGLAKKCDWSQTCPPNAKLGHFLLFKHEIQPFKVLLGLKVVKFDTKMYFKFSNFRGQTSAGGGGQALVQKRGQVSDGGIDNIFARWGDPHPLRKKILAAQYKFGKKEKYKLTSSFEVPRQVQESESLEKYRTKTLIRKTPKLIKNG